MKKMLLSLTLIRSALAMEHDPKKITIAQALENCAQELLAFSSDDQKLQANAAYQEFKKTLAVAQHQTNALNKSMNAASLKISCDFNQCN